MSCRRRLWECASPAHSTITSVTATLGCLSWTSAPSGTTLPLAAAKCLVQRNSKTYDFSFKNGNKKVLLIVTSVPVVFVPGLLARISRTVHIKEGNFVDHWSHPDNVPARDKFLSMLHAHQQAHPSQRVALVCGDVHIGNAFGIHWQGGRKPRLYQFTSSALTALETRTTQFLVEKGPRLVSGVTCPSTPFGGACSASSQSSSGC